MHTFTCTHTHTHLTHPHAWIHAYRDVNGFVRERMEPLDSTHVNLQDTMKFLVFGETYNISVFALNKHGRSNGSEVVTFTRISGMWF